MGLWPTQGDENRFGPATTLYGAVALSFVIPSEAERICSSADLSWKRGILFSNRIVISPAPACRGICGFLLVLTQIL